MSEILTREQMILKMMSVAAHALATANHIKAQWDLPEYINAVMKKEGVSEEVARKILDAHLAGLVQATQPWMDLLNEFKEMPLYHEGKQK